jgi:aspartate oxidase
LEQAGIPRTDAHLRKALAWLESHQDKEGQWPSESMNKKRDPASDAGKFMSDAATAFASMALSAK